MSARVQVPVWQVSERWPYAGGNADDDDNADGNSNAQALLFTDESVIAAQTNYSDRHQWHIAIIYTTSTFDLIVFNALWDHVHTFSSIQTI